MYTTGMNPNPYPGRGSYPLWFNIDRQRLPPRSSIEPSRCRVLVKMTNVTEADNRGPLLNIASWFTTVMMCVSVGVKLYTRLAITRTLHVDDLLTVFTMVCGPRASESTPLPFCCRFTDAQAGDCSCLLRSYRWASTKRTRATWSGYFYRRTRILSQSKSLILRFLLVWWLCEYWKPQATYVAQILYVLTIHIVKLAVLYFFINLTRLDKKRRVVDGFMVFVGIWSVIAVLVVAFQCRMPHPWKSRPGQCSNEVLSSLPGSNHLTNVASLPFGYSTRSSTSWLRFAWALCPYTCCPAYNYPNRRSASWWYPLVQT